MRTGHSTLALTIAALLLSVACTSSPPETSAPGGTQPPAPAAGTEAAVAPQEPTAEPEPPATPVDAPALSRTPAPTRGGQARPAPPVTSGGSRTPAPEAAMPQDTTSAPAAPPRTQPEPTPVPVAPPPPRLVSVPVNTSLPLVLQTDLASDTSKVEDRVSARVSRDVVVGNEVVIPEGSRVGGRVTYAQESGKVKGRAGLTVRFHTLTIGSRTYDIAAEPVRREAAGTKSKDARNIAIGAGAGAVIGAIAGGRKGAGIGAAVGGAGGTGVVLATKGEEVRMPAGTPVTTRLADPVVIELPPGSRE